MTDLGFLEKHLQMLNHLDEWFRSYLASHLDQMQCGKGCAQCCCGLFDVSLPDALRIAKGFDMLAGGTRSLVVERASIIQGKIRQEAKELREPFFLNAVTQDRIDALVDCIQDAQCPFLDERGRCLIYEDRPLACRLEGIPMVDLHDGLFGDWCELNFKNGVTPKLKEDLRLDYYEIQAIEQEATGFLSQCLLAHRQEAVTLFIPSIVAAFDAFWKESVARIDKYLQ